MATYSAILDAEVSAEAPITVSLMTRLRDNALSYLGAPTGTRAVFHQDSAPLGWTKSATHNDKALRVVSGTVGSGGSLAFSTVFGKTATDPHTLTVAQMPSHNHSGLTGNENANHTHPPSVDIDGKRVIDGGGPSIVGSVSGATTLIGTSTISNPITGIQDGVHQHAIASQGNDQGHPHNMDIRVRYMDVIVAEKAA